MTGLLGALLFFCGINVYEFTRTKTTCVALGEGSPGVSKEAAVGIAPTPSEYIFVPNIHEPQDAPLQVFGVDSLGPSVSEFG
jgi:hypothetical protein